MKVSRFPVSPMSPKLNVPAQYKETRQTYPRYTQDEIKGGAGLANQEEAV